MANDLAAGRPAAENQARRRRALRAPCSERGAWGRKGYALPRAMGPLWLCPRWTKPCTAPPLAPQAEGYAFFRTIEPLVAPSPLPYD